MNIYVFWILFLGLWAIVPLMIIKGRTEETPKVKLSQKLKIRIKVGLINIFYLLITIF